MMKKNEALLTLLFLAILCLTACGLSQADLDAQATQTAQAQPTARPTRTPLPPPARFINPPEYLEEKYKSTAGWFWMEAVEGRRSAFQESKEYQTTFYLVHEENTIGVGENDAISDTFVTHVLEMFVPSSTREKIIQFRNEHTEPGTYQAVIDGFKVEVLIIQGKGNYTLDVTESP